MRIIRFSTFMPFGFEHFRFYSISLGNKINTIEKKIQNLMVQNSPSTHTPLIIFNLFIAFQCHFSWQFDWFAFNFEMQAIILYWNLFAVFIFVFGFAFIRISNEVKNVTLELKNLRHFRYKANTNRLQCVVDVVLYWMTAAAATAHKQQSTTALSTVRHCISV